MAPPELPASPGRIELAGGERPPGHADHMPYLCARTGAVCIDRLPVTEAEVRQAGEALQAIHRSLEARDDC